MLVSPRQLSIMTLLIKSYARVPKLASSLFDGYCRTCLNGLALSVQQLLGARRGGLASGGLVRASVGTALGILIILLKFGPH
jgi:hypothetical protein